MRAGLPHPVTTGLKKDHRISEWFWDHETGFCRQHNKRDRQAHIAECLARQARAAALPPSYHPTS